MNTKCVRYLLRVDNVEEAQKVVALFARDSENSQTNLYDMQCVWYEHEEAESLMRRKTSLALAMDKWSKASIYFLNSGHISQWFDPKCVVRNGRKVA